MRMKYENPIYQSQLKKLIIALKKLSGDLQRFYRHIMYETRFYALIIFRSSNSEAPSKIPLQVPPPPPPPPIATVTGNVFRPLERRLPSLPNFRFFLPRLVPPDEELLPELLSLLFHRVNMFRKRFSVSNVGRTAWIPSLAGIARGRDFTTRDSRSFVPLTQNWPREPSWMLRAFSRGLAASASRSLQTPTSSVVFV